MMTEPSGTQTSHLHKRTARIAIFGVGAMGCLLGAHLAPLADVVLFGQWQAQLAALSTHPLTLVHPDGTRAQIRLRATNRLDALGLVDTALVLVKSGQTAQVAAQIAQVLARNGLALTLQNGLGNLEKLSAVLTPRRSALGVTAQGANVVEPGLVRHAGHGPTHLATTPATSARLVQLADLFNRAGLPTHLTSHASSLVWGKLAINAGINPLTALLRVPNGFLAEDESARMLMMRTAEEVAAVAAAQGVQLPYPDAAQRALEVALATAQNRSSMLQDILRGAPTEIDAICGAVVEYGRRHHVPTPLNAAFWRLVKQAESGEWQIEHSGDLAALQAALTSQNDPQGDRH